MILALVFVRFVVTALLFICVAGGFVFSGAAEALARRQKNLTETIERRRK